MNSVKNMYTEEMRDSLGIALRVVIVSLALATAYIHLTLGSLLFLANAAGYAVLAVGHDRADRLGRPQSLARPRRPARLHDRSRSSAGR